MLIVATATSPSLLPLVGCRTPQEGALTAAQFRAFVSSATSHEVPGDCDVAVVQYVPAEQILEFQAVVRDLRPLVSVPS